MAHFVHVTMKTNFFGDCLDRIWTHLIIMYVLLYIYLFETSERHGRFFQFFQYFQFISDVKTRWRWTNCRLKWSYLYDTLYIGRARPAGRMFGNSNNCGDQLNTHVPINQIILPFSKLDVETVSVFQEEKIRFWGSALYIKKS